MTRITEGTDAMMDYSAEFPILEQVDFFNHAAVSPIPMRARRAIEAYAEEASTLGCVKWPEWAGRVERARVTAARFLGTGPDNVAFTTSTTHGLLCIANSLAWRPGDNIVTAAGEFPANVYPWRNLAPRGVELREVAERPGHRFDPGDFRRAIDAHTRMIAVSLVQFSTGYRMPVEALGALCREHGLWFSIDGIQGLGAVPVDVASLGADSISADGHKWMLAPEGAGLLYVNPARAGEFNDSMTGWFGRPNSMDFADTAQPAVAEARRFEAGAWNIGGILGLGASLDLLNEAGAAGRWSAIEALTAQLCEGARKLGFEIVSPRDEECERSGIVAITRAGLDAERAMSELEAKNIHVMARCGWLRIGPHFYNRPEQIDNLLEALKAL